MKKGFGTEVDHPRSRGEHAHWWGNPVGQSGSSPLARGAPNPPHTDSSLAGIIPARAGSTSSPVRRTAARRDHPRSRGEHYPLLGAGLLFTGSSPLARGAPRRGAHRGHPVGIIPARAGSTPDQLRAARYARDHPRSRGEHGLDAYRPVPEPGSSPLARGAQPQGAPHVQHHRIIPARAGSTPGRTFGCLPPTDHPRSRGEHNREAGDRADAYGSSPLARGALSLRVMRGEGDGIVPARAGSTARRPVRPRRCRDHPRSRGEHPTHRRGVRSSLGSSPLARGAHQRAGEPLPDLRIIPARAGSTPFPAMGEGWGSDHPRSRGEHSDRVVVRAERSGSSPLARGALGYVFQLPLLIRIIPARAGSTESCVPRSSVCRDHPRSRGEHDKPTKAAIWNSGSSPLARGALRIGGLVGRPEGIIPARAGSTMSGPAARQAGTDHPRSRGEHSVLALACGRSGGSSPLARGARGPTLTSWTPELAG